MKKVKRCENVKINRMIVIFTELFKGTSTNLAGRMMKIIQIAKTFVFLFNQFYLYKSLYC